MTRPAIVVTGASSGIGRELARVAARDGSFMLLIGQSATALDNGNAQPVAH
jgi:short-subunit dehydrogenase